MGAKWVPFLIEFYDKVEFAEICATDHCMCSHFKIKQKLRFSLLRVLVLFVSPLQNNSDRGNFLFSHVPQLR